MTRVKICGIKTKEYALAAAEAGADFIGMVFTKSSRQVTPSEANDIISAFKGSKNHVPEFVGVFVHTPFYVVNRIAEFCHLDYVQMSGDENMDYCRSLTAPIVKVIKISGHHKPEQICKDLATWNDVLAKHKHIFLLDTYDRDRYGGTGRPIDWDIAKLIAENFKVIIAGGLTPENVATAIKTARPWGVDVSSGVETEGEKDLKKIKKFIKAVRNADAE